VEVVFRPWGYFEVILNSPAKFKIKKITVFPGHRLSLQYHNHRSEYWFCISGIGLIDHVAGNRQTFSAGQMVHIPSGSKHRVGVDRLQSENLVFIELQMGNLCDENDIVRLEDDYGRAD
jgi:mannose-6-phosphate isomerase-like protein (cupin superfamily)